MYINERSYSRPPLLSDGVVRHLEFGRGRDELVPEGTTATSTKSTPVKDISRPRPINTEIPCVLFNTAGFPSRDDRQERANPIERDPRATGRHVIGFLGNQPR